MSISFPVFVSVLLVKEELSGMVNRVYMAVSSLDCKVYKGRGVISYAFPQSLIQKQPPKRRISQSTLGDRTNCSWKACLVRNIISELLWLCLQSLASHGLSCFFLFLSSVLRLNPPQFILGPESWPGLLPGIFLSSLILPVYKLRRFNLLPFIFLLN